MTISYPLSLPSTPGFSRFHFEIESAVGVRSSPFTYATQVQRHAGQRWIAEVTMPPMPPDVAEPWLAVLASLDGPYGTFLMGDVRRKTPRGVATGTPLVKGAGQTGLTLVTDGWTSSVTGILKAGDCIQIGQRLYKVMADVNSSGSGEATLDIRPRLRESPADNAAITTSNAKGLFRLASPAVPLHDSDTEGLLYVSFAAVEAV